MATKQLETLYNSLKQGNWDVPDSYDSFERTLTAPGKRGYENRRTLYESLRDENWDVPDTYESFSNTLFKPAAQTAQANRATQANQASQVKRSEKGWEPSYSDRLRMEKSLERSEKIAGQLGEDIKNTRRVAESGTQRGRDVEKSARMQAKMAGVDSSFMGDDLVGITPARGGSGADAGASSDKSGSLPIKGAAPYSVKMEDGEQRVEYMLADGSLTTDRVEADRSAALARKGRQQQEYRRNLRRNLEKRLGEAEDRLKALYGEREAEDRSAREGRGVLAEFGHQTAEAVRGMHPTPRAEGTDKSALDKDIEQAYAEVLKLKESLREYDSSQAAADGSWWGNLARGVRDGALDSDTWSLGVVNASLNKAAREADVNTESGRKLAESAVMANDLMADAKSPGALYSGARLITRMALDPLTKVGGVLGNSVGGAVTRAIAERGVKGMGRSMLERFAMNSLGARLAGATAGGGANFMAYEGLGDIRQQVIDGGYYDERGIFHEGISLEHAAERGLHGFGMGAAMGFVGFGIGNFGNGLVRATDNGVGKAALKGGTQVASVLGEGTIFAVPDIYEFHTMDDARFDELYANKYGYANVIDEQERAKRRREARNSQSWDAWTDSQAMVLGMKMAGKPLEFAMEGIANPKEMAMRSVGYVGGVLAELRGQDAQRGMRFEERLAKMIDRSVEGTAFTKDELKELREHGYGELSNLFERAGGEVKEGVPGRKVSVSRKGIRVEDDTRFISGGLELEVVGSDPKFDGYTNVEELMGDGTVSASTRAKAYYIVTGHMLAMPTVAGRTVYKNERTGEVTVIATTAQGEVVVSKRFKMMDGAFEDYCDKIDRQIELNSVEVGERFREAAAEEAVMKAACEVVASKYGTTAEGILKVCERVDSEPEDLSDSERKIAEEVKVAIERNGKVVGSETPAEMRERIFKETGVDIDKALKRDKWKRSDKERAAVEQYQQELFGERPWSNKAEDVEPIRDTQRLIGEDGVNNGGDGFGNGEDFVNSQDQQQFREKNGDRSEQDNDERAQPWQTDGSRMASDSTGGVASYRDRSDIRVYEEGLEVARHEHSGSSARNRREAESERLVGLAKQNGQYFSNNDCKNLGDKQDKGTGESEVYVNKEGGKVYKVKDPYAKSPLKGDVQPEDAIFEHHVHNKYFPETPYSFEGISDDLGDVRIVLSQPFVESVGQPTQAQIEAALAERGLLPEGNYRYGNDEVSVTDVTGDNALLGADGKVYFIDPVINYKKPVREILDGEGKGEGTQQEEGALDAQMDAAWGRYDDARRETEDLLSDDELDEFGRDPYGLAERLSDEDTGKYAAVLNRINAEAEFLSLQRSAEQEAERAEAKRRTHRDSGLIERAEIDGRDGEVYVISGHVEMRADGSGVDRERSDSRVFVYDPQTGKVGMESIKAIVRVEKGDESTFDKSAAAAEGATPVDKPAAANGEDGRFDRAAESDGVTGVNNVQKGEAEKSDDSIERKEELSVSDNDKIDDSLDDLPCELTEEFNEFGKPFVKSSDGSPNFGYIDEESGLSPLPIRLSLGENYKDEEGVDHGYGYLHIDAGHRDEILQNGFSSIEEFVETIAKNYTDIREGAKIGKNQTYLLEVSDERNNTLFIQLSQDGRYWNVNSAGIFRKKYSRRKQKVYSKPAVGSGTATDTTEVNSGQEYGATAPARNSSETSVGKVSQSLANEQAEEQKSLELGAELPLNEKGKPDYTKVEPSVAWDALSQKYGSDSAQEFAEMQVKRSEELVKQAKRIKIKSTDDFDEFEQSRRERQAKIDAAQAELEHWKGVASERKHREDAAERERKEAEKARIEAEKAAARAWREEKQKIDKRLHEVAEEVKDDPEALEILKNMEPQDIWEAASVVLSANKVLLSNEGTHRGYFHEMGSNMRGESKEFFGLFASRAKGGKSIAELAGDQMKEICEINGIPYDNQEAFSALMDMLSSSSKRSEITHYIANNRIEQARKYYDEMHRMDDAQEYERYLAAERDNYCLEMYGVTSAEYDEIADQIAKDHLENFNEQEYFSNIADEYFAREEQIQAQSGQGIENELNRGTDVRASGTDKERVESGASERRDVESDTEGSLHGGGDEVLYAQGLGERRGAGKDEVGQGVQSEAGDGGGSKEILVSSQAGGGEEVEPTGYGDFGPIFTQFKGDAQGAIRKLLELKAGEAIGALHHKDVGDIDLVWGKEGSGHSDGMGLAKLVKYHPEVLENLQEIIDDMVVVKRSENRINLESETHRAAVRLTWNNEAKKWLLTAFEKKETPKSVGKTTDTGDNPMDKRGDTTLSQNSGVSERKDSESLSKKQDAEAESFGGDIFTQAREAAAAAQRKRWAEMDGASRLKEAEKQPLTEDEIKNAEGLDATIRANALAYLRGKRGAVQEISYLKAYEDVRYTTDGNGGVGGGADGSQLAGADNGGNSEGESRGGSSRGVSIGMDRGRGGSAVSSAGADGADSKGDAGVSAGARSDKPIREGAPGVEGVSGGGKRSARGGVSGDARVHGQQSGGSASRGSAGKNGKRGGAAGRRASSKAERGSGVESAKNEFLDILKEFGKRGKDGLSLSVAGMNARQIEMLPRLIGAGAKLGVELIKEGYRTFKEWREKMREHLSGPLKLSGFTEAEVDEWIQEMWDTDYEIDGRVQTVGEWASEIGKEALRAHVSQTLEQKRQLQRQAETVGVVECDIENIRETLPFLMEKQQDDVLRAEEQFFSEAHSDHAHGNGKGYLFTNGTGTGKTYTGLGIVKRFVKRGKSRILILTPSQPKVTDWKKDGANLGLEIKSLDEWAKSRGTTATTEKGEGVVITTYANFRQNESLLEDDFDLIVYDESHRILENKKGAATEASAQHFKVSNKNESIAFLRKQEMNPVYREILKAHNEYEALRGKYIKEYEESGVRPYDALREVPEINGEWSAEQTAKYSDLKAIRDRRNVLSKRYEEQEKPRLKEEAKQAAERTKVVFLSATPFNTRENLDYAEGYIFSYPKGHEGERINGRSRFYLDTFGAAYKFRYGRLESRRDNPAAIAQQERDFSDHLQNNLQTMSGRMIDSEYDYSRDFPTVTGAYAPRFNEAISQMSQDEAMREGVWDVIGSYQYSQALFECMKVNQTIPRIKEHLAAGRKVVIFHRRQDSDIPLGRPFDMIFVAAERRAMLLSNKEEQSARLRAISEMRAKMADMLEWEKSLDLRMPREQLQEEFGRENVLCFSGKESTSAKNKAVKEFNDDESGKNIILVQEASGKEGISLHDTTGRHQRVLITLPLPQSPITALQIEGRIYRIGNKSNAIFEYPLLGLDSEMILFGQQFNSKVGTTENLALGSQARDLQRSFAEGVELHSGEVPLDKQGIGGKEFDGAKYEEVDPFDRAVLDFYGNKKLSGRRDNREGKDYYPTPEPLGYMMAQWGHIGEGESVLEPSAGHGAIARYVPASNFLTAIEPSMNLFGKVQLRCGGVGRRYENTIFENYNVVNKHDVVLMNPPFGHGGKLAIDHVAKAFSHLEEGGRVVALIPRGQADKRFDDWYSGEEKAVLVGEVLLPDITFSNAGTAVNCRVVIVDKVSNGGLRRRAASNFSRIELNNDYSKIEDFFEDLRGKRMPGRTIDTNAKTRKKCLRGMREVRESFKSADVELTDTGLYVRGMGVTLRMDWAGMSEDMIRQRALNEYRSLMNKEYNRYFGLGERGKQLSACLRGILADIVGKSEDEIDMDLGLNGLTEAREPEVEYGVHSREGVEIVNARFNDELEQQIAGTLPQGHVYDMGMPGAVLLAAGFPNLPIELSSKQLGIKANQRNHEFELKDVMNLPRELQTPIAVFRYGNKDKSENVIVGLNKEGKQFVVGVHFNQNRRGIVVSDIRGLFPKENAEWLNWISQGKSEWLDKEKIQALIDQQRTNLAEVEYLDLDSVAKVVKEFENPKLGDEGLSVVNDKTGNYQPSLFDEDGLAGAPATRNHTEVKSRVRIVQPSLFDETELGGATPGDKAAEREMKGEGADLSEGAKQANRAIDDYSQKFVEVFTGYEYLIDWLRERGEDTEDVETRMGYELQDLGDALRAELEGYYRSEGNSEQDSWRMAWDMAARVRADISLRLRDRYERPAPHAAIESDRIDFEHLEIGLPELKEGEFSLYKRRFIEDGMFPYFTGKGKIETIADVAYMFRTLQDYSVENAFAVLVKDEKPLILHIGVGSQTASVVDMMAIRAGYEAYGADKVYFVHNHPSGNLKPSPQDKNLVMELRKMLGDEKVGDGIIIDVTSGWYSTFGGDYYSNGEHLYPKYENEDEHRYNVGQFAGNSYSKDYDYDKLVTITGAESVAAFVSTRRLGEGPKLGYLLLDRANHVVGNILSGHGDYGDVEGLSDEIVRQAVAHGATSVVLYGNRDLDGSKRVNRLVQQKSSNKMQVLDALKMLSGGDYISARDEGIIKESEGEYRFRTSGAGESFESRRDRAVKERGLVAPGLAEMEVKVVDVARHDFKGTGKQAIEKARFWAREHLIGQHIAKEGTYDEFTYKIDEEAVGKYLSASSTKGSDNLGVHLAVLKSLPAIIDSSVDAEVHPDYIKSGVRSAENGIGDDNLLVHRMYGAVEIDRYIYRVKTTLKEIKGADASQPYNYQVTKLELLISGSEASDALSNSNKLMEIGGAKSISAANLLQNVEKSYDPGVKLLEASENTFDKPAPRGENNESAVGEIRFRTSEEIDREYPNWLDGTTTDSGKHTTQVEGTRKTYSKVGDWIEDNLGKGVSILDASSGMGYGTRDLRARGFNIEDVEPYQSEQRKRENPATYDSYASIDKKYDVVISNAVLNVIPDDWRRDVLHDMTSRLNDGGILFINTRKAGEEKTIKDKIELDSAQEVLVKRNGKIASYQRFFTPVQLRDWVESELGDGYRVEIANERNSGTKGLAAVVVSKVGEKTYEDAERMRAIMELTPIEIERNTYTKSELKEIFNNLPSVRKDGREIEFFHSAFRKVHKDGGLFEQVVPKLDEVLRESVLAYSEEDNLGGSLRADGSVHKAHPNVDRFDNYVGKVSIDGKEYYVRTIVQRQRGQSGTHSFFVTSVDVYENTDYSMSDPGSPRARVTVDGIVDAKLQQFFERASSESKKVGETAGAKRRRAEGLAEKFGTRVRIVEDLSEIKHEDAEIEGQMRQSPGWYDVSTGEVVLVLPNNRDVEDVACTVFHEVVAHKGLRELVGDGNYDAFCDEVYDHLKDELKSAVDEEAGRRFIDEPGKGYAHARRVAVDEMFGRLAEKGFEDFSSAERGIWERLKQKVLDAINKFLGSLKLPKWVSLGDDELRYMLWKSGERMRTFDKPAEREIVGRGDEAAERVSDKIEALFDAAVSGKFMGKSVEVGQLTAEGRAFLENLSGMNIKEKISFMLNPSDLQHIHNRHFGENEKDARNIPLTRADIRNISEIITNPDNVLHAKEADGDKRNLFFFLKEADEGSYNLLEVYTDRRGNLTTKSYFKSKEGVSQRAMLLKESSALTSVTDGSTLLAGAKLPKFFESPNGESHYDHRVSQIEKGKLTDSLNALLNGEAENQLPVGGWGYKGTISKSDLQEKSSKNSGEILGHIVRLTINFFLRGAMSVAC